MEKYIAYLTSQRDIAEKKYRFLRYAMLIDTPCEGDAEYWKNRLSFFEECLVEAHAAHDVAHNTSPPVQAVTNILDTISQTIITNRELSNPLPTDLHPPREKGMYYLGANNALHAIAKVIKKNLWFDLPVTHDDDD